MNDDHNAPPIQNPKIPEGINAVRENPFKDLILLGVGVLVAFVVAMFLLWHLLTWGARFVPLAWELRISQSISSQFIQPSEQSVRLQKRLDTILLAMHYDGDTPITVHYVDSDVINAFATLGGQIFVFQGLLDVVETDIGLDMVLAHEAAHILNRDPIRSVAGTLGIQLVYALMTGNGDFAEMNGLLSAGNKLMLLQYSRDQERAADNRALDALEQMYDDLSGADELFRFIAQEENYAPDFLSTHPNPKSRIESIQNRLSNE